MCFLPALTTEVERQKLAPFHFMPLTAASFRYLVVLSSRFANWLPATVLLLVSGTGLVILCSVYFFVVVSL
jgi:hypothetical protein